MSRYLAIGRVSAFAWILAVLLAVSPADPLGAQTATNAFGGLSENSDEPIDIESDTLTVYDAKKYATFKGNVKAVQGTTTLRAAELDVHYVGGSDRLTGRASAAGQVSAQGAQDENDAQSGINKIEARGNVVITSEDDQTTTSDWALYDVPAQLVTVGGNVVLTQGENVLKGDRLVIDLKTGESHFENIGTAETGRGRIRALFMPKGSAAGKDGAESKKSRSSEPAGAAQDPASGEQAPGNWAADDDEPVSLMPEFR